MPVEFVCKCIPHTVLCSLAFLLCFTVLSCGQFVGLDESYFNVLVEFTPLRQFNALGAIGVSLNSIN